MTMEEYTAAKTLTLISKIGECGGHGGGGGEESRVFECKTCLKKFSSFQALGGHRASHTKPIYNDENESPSPSSSSSSSSSSKKAKMMTSHTCPICGIDFPMGQALGGHMRKHRNEKEKEKVAGELVTHSFFPEKTLTVTTSKKSSSGKRVACLDHVDNLINLKLELGRNFS